MKNQVQHSKIKHESPALNLCQLPELNALLICMFTLISNLGD